MALPEDNEGMPIMFHRDIWLLLYCFVRVVFLFIFCSLFLAACQQRRVRNWQAERN